MTTKNNELPLSKKISTLDEAVDWFYSDDFTLDKAADKYQDALTLANEIEQDLKELKNRITVIDQDFTKE